MKITKVLLLAVFSFFFIAAIYKSSLTMRFVPLHDFDEANRSESAKRMIDYHEFSVPLTGSPFWRIPELQYHGKTKNDASLYFHMERTPLSFWFMSASISLFGRMNEWAFRLPSFLLGLSTFVLLFATILKLRKSIDPFALALGILTLATSSDWWLSSQMAHQDTGLSFFLFGAVSSLLIYLTEKQKKWLVLSGLSFGLAFLVKGPAAVGFVFPVITALLIGSISIIEALLIAGLATGVVLPWVIWVCAQFSLGTVFKVLIVEFPKSRLLESDASQKAPVYWYLRWFIESLRPGFALFISLFSFQSILRFFKKEDIILLSYILGSLLFFSLGKNKVWWYVMPTIPAIALYVALITDDIFKKYHYKYVTFSLITLISALPIALGATNTVAIGYFAGVLILNILLLIFVKGNIQKWISQTVLICSFAFALFIFFLRFPVIHPSFTEMKPVARLLRSIQGDRCLYLTQNMPYESALFYSGLQDITYLTDKTHFDSQCMNFIITRKETPLPYSVVLTKGELILYRVNNN